MLKSVSLSRILEKCKCDEMFFTSLLSSKAKPYNPNSSHSPPIILIFLLLFTHLYFHRNFPSLSLVNFFRRVEISFYIYNILVRTNSIAYETRTYKNFENNISMELEVNIVRSTKIIENLTIR